MHSLFPAELYDAYLQVKSFHATRFTTSVKMGGAAELLAVGTAVVIEPE
jgi:hypothetical protein